MQVFDAEWQSYLIAGRRFYADPEDAEATQQNFFQSSLFLLRLAESADSANASVEYHIGKVLARKSYNGFGTWNGDSLRVAIQHLRRAERLAVGSYAPLKEEIEKVLDQEQHNFASLKH